MEASRTLDGKMNDHVCQYFHQALHYMDKAIDNLAFMEVIISSFALFVFASRQEHAHLQAAAFFYNGLTTAFARLLDERREVPVENINLAFDVWTIALQSLEISYWAEVRRYERRSTQIDDAFSRVNNGRTIDCLNGIQGVRRLRNTMCMTEPLRSHLMFSWDNYLAIKVRPGSDCRDSSLGLRRILTQIIVVSGQKHSVKPSVDGISADEISDKLLFGMAAFLDHLMDANGDVAMPNVIQSADDLCDLCSAITKTMDRDLLRTYCLFLVGLVHNKRIAHRFGELMFQWSPKPIPGFGYNLTVNEMNAERSSIVRKNTW